MTTDFYRQFEDHFRGSRAQIKERLAFYQPFLESLRNSVSQSAALDLGCGRGEWLEILTEVGFKAQGVDLDEGMLQACQELGLSAKRAEALETLSSYEDSSLALVSALHVIEHIPFDQMIELIKEAHRVLAPGGLLILETPNSENLYSTTTSFYLDPTHSKPIPQALLSFVAGYGGFKTHKIVRLNETGAQHDGGAINLTNVLFGASPDYALIGIKANDNAHIAPYQPLLERNYGVSLLDLAKQYDQAQSASEPISRLEQGLGIVSDRFFAAGCKLDDAYEMTAQQLSKLSLLEDKLAQLDALMQTTRSELEQTIKAMPAGQTRLLQTSTTQRITRPFRAVGRIANAVRHHGLKGFVMPFADYAHSSPARLASTTKWLRRFGLHKAAERLEQTNQQP